MIKHYEDDHQQNIYREGIYGVVDAMEVEILALRKANTELIKELWMCHARSGYELDESSIEATIETYQSAPN